MLENQQPGSSHDDVLPAVVESLTTAFPTVEPQYFRDCLRQGRTAEQIADSILTASPSVPWKQECRDESMISSHSGADDSRLDFCDEVHQSQRSADTDTKGSALFPAWPSFFKSWPDLDKSGYYPGGNKENCSQTKLSLDSKLWAAECGMQAWMSNHLLDQYPTVFKVSIRNLIQRAVESGVLIMALYVMEEGEKKYLESCPGSTELPLNVGSKKPTIMFEGDFLGTQYKVSIQLLKNRRKPSHVSYDIDSCPHQEIKRQYEWLQLVRLRNQQHDKSPNEDSSIDCDICCSTLKMQDFVACTAGHLVCRDCLRMSVEEAVNGAATVDVTCVSDTSCTASYTHALLRRHLSRVTYRRLAERQYEKGVAAVNDVQLERCAKCNAPYIIDVPVEVNKVLECENPACKKKTCRVCKKDWDAEHFGVPCKELENDEETKKRKEYEEEMTEALLRRCPQCQQAILKEAGCNKMTCNNCVKYFCYVCKKQITDKDPYMHFCRHMHDPATKTCLEKCERCLLFEDTKQRDDDRIRQLQERAQEELTRGAVKPTIGVDIEPPPTAQEPGPPVAADVRAINVANPAPAVADRMNRIRDQRNNIEYRNNLNNLHEQLNDLRDRLNRVRPFNRNVAREDQPGRPVPLPEPRDLPNVPPVRPNNRVHHVIANYENRHGPAPREPPHNPNPQQNHGARQNHHGHRHNWNNRDNRPVNGPDNRDNWNNRPVNGPDNRDNWNNRPVNGPDNRDNWNQCFFFARTQLPNIGQTEFLNCPI